MKQEFRLYGLFGYPLSHTLSPVMHEAAFARLGLEAHYLTLELSPSLFRKAMRGLSALSLSGFNVTVPHKEAVMPYLDALTPEARGIGAVNTVFKKGKRWIGTNTDVYGFMKTLREEGKFNPKGWRALVFGAGGAARAVIYGLARDGAKAIALYDLEESKSKKIIRDYQRLFPKTVFEWVRAKDDAAIREKIKGADLVVNATTVGLKDSSSKLFPDNFLPSVREAGRKLFFDLIYHHSETALMRVARQRGHKAISGLGMLLHQGARALELWTKRQAPVEVMRQALVEALGK